MTTVLADSWPSWLPCRLLTIDDVAVICHTSTRTARRWIDTGLLPRVPMGRLVRVRPEDLLALINGQRMTGTDNNTGEPSKDNYS